MKNSKKTKKLLAAFSCLAMFANVETTQNNAIYGMENQENEVLLDEDKKNSEEKTQINTTSNDTTKKVTNIGSQTKQKPQKEKGGKINDSQLKLGAQEFECRWNHFKFTTVNGNDTKTIFNPHLRAAIILQDNPSRETEMSTEAIEKIFATQKVRKTENKMLPFLLDDMNDPPGIIICVPKDMPEFNDNIIYTHPTTSRRYVRLYRKKYLLFVDPLEILTEGIQSVKKAMDGNQNRKLLRRKLTRKIKTEQQTTYESQKNPLERTIYEAIGCRGASYHVISSLEFRAAQTTLATIKIIDYLLSGSCGGNAEENNKPRTTINTTRPAVTKSANQKDKPDKNGMKEDEEIQKNIGNLKSFGNLLTQRMLNVSETKNTPPNVMERPHALLIKPKEDNTVESVNTTGLINLFYPKFRFRKKEETLKEVLDNTPDPEEVIISVGECKSRLVEGFIYKHEKSSKTYVYLKRDQFEILINPKEILAAGIQSGNLSERDAKQKEQFRQQLAKAFATEKNVETLPNITVLKHKFYSAMGYGAISNNIRNVLVTSAVNASAATLEALETILTRPCDVQTITTNEDGETTTPRWEKYAIGTGVGIIAVLAGVSGYKIYNNNSTSHSATKHKNTNSKKGTEVQSSDGKTNGKKTTTAQKPNTAKERLEMTASTPESGKQY